MPTQDIVISLKFNNYNYAPGIATYGIDGKTGIPGIDGNNIYFTDCNLLTNTSNDLKILAELIANNYLPVKGSTIVVNRAYKNYDFFFDYNGIIYQLTDIDALINNKNIGGIYSDYFNIAGKIRITDDAGKFEWVGDRLVLNSSIYGGYDVITINNPELGESYINKNAVVNIISDNINENDNIEMIKMQSIDDIDIEDGKLSVYYKTTENAFYLDSNKPIVINGDVKIDNTADNPEYDGFSTVLTSNDTITYFKHICDKLRYNIIYDDDVNKYKLVIYSNEENENDQRKTLEYLINRKDIVFGKIYTNENDLILIRIPNNIINSSLGINDYADLYTSCIFSCDEPQISTFKVDSNTSISSDYIKISKNYVDEKNQLNIDVSLTGTYAQMVGNFALAIKLNKDINNNKYITETYNNESGQNKFDFYVYDSNENIELHLYPLEKFLCESTSTYTYPPIVCPINFVNNIENGEYTMYFKLEYVNNPSTLLIKDIMIFNRDDLLNSNDITVPHIEAYLSDSVTSILRFALLHNTEVFLNYQDFS